MLTTGPFAGQMLIGDVTYGGLQRAYLEKVNGEYQGALFRHDPGPGGGRHRGRRGPGRRDLRRRPRRRRQLGPGRQARRTACRSSPPTAPARSTSSRCGRRRTASRWSTPSRCRRRPPPRWPSTYRVKQWRYVPTAGLRRPEGRRADADGHLGDRSPPTAGRSRSPSTACRPAGSCTSARRARSPPTSGQSLWSTEAWYTLNAIPGGASATQPGAGQAGHRRLVVQRQRGPGQGGQRQRRRRQHRQVVLARRVEVAAGRPRVEPDREPVRGQARRRRWREHGLEHP